jgi:TrmH family RNA methyltransferase
MKEGALCSGSWWTLLQEQSVPVYQVSPRLYQTLTETQHPQDVLGIIEQPAEPSAFPVTEKVFCGLILSELQDPGNLGTIIRTAWAAGFKTLFITPRTVDPYSGKVVRASQGGIFNIKLYAHPIEEILAWANQQGIKVWAADPKGTRLHFEADLTGSNLFLLGNEAHGFASQLEQDQAVEGLKIPLPGGAESLNVSVAAAILLYEALRQRKVVGEV